MNTSIVDGLNKPTGYTVIYTIVTAKYMACFGSVFSAILIGVLLPQTPASALSAIYAVAGASGAYYSPYDQQVSYFTSSGLSVANSGSLEGTTASYSPTSAATGLTAITLTAAVDGLSSSSAMAGADLSTGLVRLAASTSGLQSDAGGNAELYDDLTFHVVGGGSKQITVISHLDGAFSLFADTSSRLAASYTFNLGASNFSFVSQGSLAGFTFSTGNALGGGPPMGWDSYGFSDVTPTGFDFVGTLTVADGEMRNVSERLHLDCQAGVTCDFYHTGSVAFDLPTGTSFTSGSGVFLTAQPSPSGVPEAAVWVMLIIGFGLTGVATRRQRATRDYGSSVAT